MVHVFHVAQGAFANAQAAKQPVGLEHLRAQYLGQFATGQAPHDFHLEQPVLGMHIAEGAVQIGLVLGAQVRHATVVIAHGDRALQVGECFGALAGGLLTVDIPAGAGHEGGNQDSEHGQAAFHGRSLSHSP